MAYRRRDNYNGFQTFNPQTSNYYSQEAFHEYYYEPSHPYDNFFHFNSNFNLPNTKEFKQKQTRQEHNVVNRASLYRKSALQNRRQDLNRQQLPTKWTDLYWQKHEEDSTLTDDQKTLEEKTIPKLTNKIEKALNIMLSQPVQMSKGKSMLEKMGWKGGGLGKDGGGILEPIMPKATYASQTIGLGLLNESTCKHSDTFAHKNTKNEKQKQAEASIYSKSGNAQDVMDMWFNPDDEELQYKNYFKTNLLLNILEFVKDSKKIELKFESKFSNSERKKIHQIVENIRECEDIDTLYFDDDDEKDIFGDILKYNNYTLYTESVTEGSSRCVTLYKEAPSQVYITSPHHLQEDRDYSVTKEFDVSIESFHRKEPHKGKPSKIYKKSETVKFSNMEKILYYFKEFASKPLYLYDEFRFLGDFSRKQQVAIRHFLQTMSTQLVYDNEHSEDFFKILSHKIYFFMVIQDRNGGSVVYKIHRDNEHKLAHASK